MKERSSQHQLLLPLDIQENYTFDNFYPGSNKIILHCVKDFILRQKFSDCFYLWGHPFSGCTHLLKACYTQAKSVDLRARYISLKDFQKSYTPNDLKKLLYDDLVCCDEVESIAGKSLWEEALFSLFNFLKENCKGLIIGSHHTPDHLNFHLNDLTSRLNSGLLFQVRELTDVEKIQALKLRAHLKGLVLPDQVAQFLLSRLVRSPKVLFSVLTKLDQASLVQQRKLTIPFVKEVLNL